MKILVFQNEFKILKKRKRLRKIVRSILPSGFGAIIRTNAEAQEENLLLNDLKSLIDSWRDIEKIVKEEKSPALLYKDATITSSVMRDLFSEDINQLIVDNKKTFREIKNYVKQVAPTMLEKVELYVKREPMFDHYGVEKEIANRLREKFG